MSSRNICWDGAFPGYAVTTTHLIYSRDNLGIGAFQHLLGRIQECERRSPLV